MESLTLLSLRLHAPLAYAGMENPPFAGLGKERQGKDLGEGDEEVFIFDDEDLIAFDPDDGPRTRGELPPPSFHGRLADPKAGHGPGQEPWTLPAGDYLFMQWRPVDASETLAGIEWFAREGWWEGDPGKGPFILRRILEDGRLATQLLRARYSSTA